MKVAQPFVRCQAERLHQLPGKEITSTEIANLAGSNDVIQRGERLLERRFLIE
jgi:hypothetical protein